MALRNQPYLPLYIQDFLTDEKLIECSAQATGVYIRLMCIMHKSEEYGTILLRQNDQQTTQQILNFARKLSKQMPYEIEIINISLQELIEQKVIEIIDNKLIQKRMVKDNELSEKRKLSGKKGGFATAKMVASAKDFAKAKMVANTENEIEYENENENVIKIEDEFILKIKDFYFSFFNKKAFLSFEQLKKIVRLTNDNNISLEQWETLLKNASKGWKINGNTVKPNFDKILEKWNLFLSDDYNLHSNESEVYRGLE